MKEIYLDNAATTKPLPKVVEVINEYLTKKWHNPSSQSSAAININGDIEAVRKLIKRDIGAAPEDDIIFTSGGSEANCLAIEGFLKYYTEMDRDSFFVDVSATEIEHSSIIKCIKNWGDTVDVTVNKSGEINFADLELYCRSISNIKGHFLISIQFANNEIGTIQDIKVISKMVHEVGGLLHVDAVQAYPSVKIDVNELGIDMMSVSGHKFGCPKGIGFLYKKACVDIDPIIYGSQNKGLRGGTENVPYIMGMGKTVEMLMEKRSENTHYTYDLWKYLEFQLKEHHIGSLLASPQHRLSTIFPIAFFDEGFTAEGLMYYLNIYGIHVSVGAACDSSSGESSHVLKAIGLSENKSKQVLRVSFSPDNTKEDINELVKRMIEYKAIVKGDARGVIK